MKDSGYRVVVIGTSSLLGKELLGVLEERGFPMATLKSVEDEWAEPELPFVDMNKGTQEMLARLAELPADFDFAFIASPSRRLGAWLEQLKSLPTDPQNPRFVIDLTVRDRTQESSRLRIPFLDAPERSARREPGILVSPHAGTILTSALMVRLAAHFPIRTAVGHLYSSASEIGPRAIEELQKQTVNLLSFQKVPQQVFGGQMAFNLLPRLGTPSEQAGPVEALVRSQLRDYLGDRAPWPALRLLRVPVFYSSALSLYVETEERVSPADLVAALEGRPLRIRRGSEKPPSQVEAAGSNEILVDAIEPDSISPEGIWLWAVADNLRLAALNAAQIAEGLIAQRQALNLLR